ncbi:rhamnosyltransferase WsaF family glycosyltransferase [Cystobacter fuscus]|nr:glycosyltransferase [Cystobacter fuscus]
MLELAEMVAAQRRVVEELRECTGSRCTELVAHERMLRWLTEELRQKSGALKAASTEMAPMADRGIAPSPVSSLASAANVLVFSVPDSHRRTVGKAVTAAKRAFVEGLKPFHMESMRPQYRFNQELVAVLNELVALRAGSGDRERAERVWSRLVPMANPTEWNVRSHRGRGFGMVVKLAKHSYLSALGPLLKALFQGQSEWNTKAIEAVARFAHVETSSVAGTGALIEELRRLSDPFARPEMPAGVKVISSLWREVFRRQTAFNQELTEYLRQLLDVPAPVPTLGVSEYESWCARREPAQITQAAQAAAQLARRPRLSVLLVAGNASEVQLQDSIDSLARQSYPEWEVRIAEGDVPLRPLVARWVERYGWDAHRLQLVSQVWGEELERAQGEFCALLTPGDVLAPHAFALVACRANMDVDFDVLYVDEDHLDEKGLRSQPFFKPDWSPDLLRTCNYWGEFLVVRTSLLREVGGSLSGLTGPHAHELSLRLSERTARIAHLARVLVHRRMGSPSLSEGIAAAQVGLGRVVLAEHLKRMGEEADVELSPSGFFRVRYPVQGTPRVSIIVPFKDKPELLRTLVSSLFRYTRYENLELLLISNNSTQPETFALLEQLTDPRIRKLTWDHPFNYSAINNFGVQHATGELLLFLNNDIEVIEPDWLEELISQVQRPEVGVVGPRLLYPNGTLQHVGVVVGQQGFAGHAFAGLAPHASTAQGRADWTRNYLAVTGACLMMRRDVFERIGGYDESFIVCGSDVELCLRAVQHELRVVYTSHCTLVHHESVTRRADAIPENDFWRSFVAYRPYLTGGDPFYNENLSLLSSHGALREAGEDAETFALRVLTSELPSSRIDDVTGTRANQLRHLSEHMRALDYSLADVEKAREEAPKRIAALRAGSLERVTWFVPGFGHPYGGVHTILRFADLLRRRYGVENSFVVYDNNQVTAREMEARVMTLFPELPGRFRIIQRADEFADLPPSDLAIATLWTSAYALLQYPHAKARAYFVQDFEPLFYPAGSYYALAEQTYRMGLHGIFNTKGLHDHVTSNYPMTGCWFEPTVERHVFHDKRPVRSGPVRIFFYGRPSTDRNAFELGMAALRQLKLEFGAEVDIVTAGEKWDPSVFGLAGTLKNHGVLPYEKTGDLYRECDVGLCFMFTKHPSYLPFEMMACGVTVVTNNNPANLWLLEHERNCLLAEPTYSCVLEQLRRAVRDAQLRDRIGKAAAERVRRTSWEEQVDQVYATLMGRPVQAGMQGAGSSQPDAGVRVKPVAGGV